MNIKKVGEQIAVLRKTKGLTQSELGERIGVSFQAVSKWERGETLPDVTLLPDLAKILETTVDYILLGSDKVIEYKGKFTVTDIKKHSASTPRPPNLGGEKGFFVISKIAHFASNFLYNKKKSYDLSTPYPQFLGL